MQNIKRDGKQKQVKTDLGIILATELGLLSTLKRIKFNPKPSTATQNTINPNQTRLVDFHMEISKKIDDVIQKHEQENTTEQRIVEPRTTWTKTPQTPIFKTEIPIDTKTTSFDNELFELEIPTNNIIKQNLTAAPNIQNQPVFVGPIQPKNTSIFAVGDHSEDKLLTTLGRIKINKERTKTKNSTKNKTSKKNGYNTAKNDYQEVKTELEKKKHELEEIERLAKQKEEELKNKEQERKEKEKRKIIEQKRREKEEKLKAKQELKLTKEKEQETQKEGKIKQLEQRKLEKQKEKELKEQERLKELKAKEIEKQKQRELKEQEKLRALKEKQIEEEKKRQQTAKKITKEKKPITINFLKKKETKKEETATKTEIKTTEKEVETNIQPPEDDLIKAFEIIDDLLGKLPDETIDKFVKSNDFEIYEKVVSKYKKK